MIRLKIYLAQTLAACKLKATQGYKNRYTAWLEFKVQIKITGLQYSYSTSFCWLAYICRLGLAA